MSDLVSDSTRAAASQEGRADTTRKRLPTGKRRPLRRALFYSSCLVAALAYLSYRLIWAHPRQVAQRVTRDLESRVTGEVRVRGARYRALEGLRVDEIAVDAPRVVGGTRSFARARGVHVDVDVDDVECPVGFGTLGAWLDAARAAGVERVLAVCSARVEIEREVTANETRWNVEGLWRDDGRTALLGSQAELAVRELEVVLRTSPGLGATGLQTGLAGLREVQLRDLVVSLGADSLRAHALLREGPIWTGGRLELEWTPDVALVVRGRATGLREIDEWLPFLPDGLRRVVLGLAPVGEISLELEEARLRPDGELRIDLTLEQWAGELSLGGVRLRGVQGRSRWEMDRVRFGEDAELPASRALLWGLPARLSGTLHADSTPPGERAEASARPTEGAPDAKLAGNATRTMDRVRFALEAAASRELALAEDAPILLREFIDWLRPRGTLEGTVELLGRLATRGGEARWTGDFEVRDVTVRGLAALEAPRLKATISTDASGAFSGGIDVEDLLWRGLARAKGRVEFEGAGETLSLRAERWSLETGVERSPEAGGGERERTESESESESETESETETETESAEDSPAMEAAAAPGGPGASFSATLTRAAGGTYGGALSWEAVPLASAPLRAETVSGRIEIRPRGASGPGDRGTRGGGRATPFARGACELGAGQLPAGIAGSDSFVFRAGRAQIELTTEGVEIRGLELRDDSGVVRARGRLRWEGELDVVVLRAGPRHRVRVEALRIDAPPREWILAAPVDFAAYRISGGVSAPHSRPIEALDPAFLESE